jgi:GNAT superfamily N-acetyltransferase
MEASEIRPAELAEVILLASEMHAESPAYRDMPFDPVQTGGWIAMHIRLEDMAAWGVWTPTGELAGVMFASVAETFFGPTLLAQEDGIYVRPKYRGTTATAALLVERYLAWARQKGAFRADVTLTAGIDDSRAFAFFARYGFTRVGQHLGVQLHDPS